MPLGRRVRGHPSRRPRRRQTEYAVHTDDWDGPRITDRDGIRKYVVHVAVQYRFQGERQGTRPSRGKLGYRSTRTRISAHGSQEGAPRSGNVNAWAMGNQKHASEPTVGGVLPGDSVAGTGDSCVQVKSTALFGLHGTSSTRRTRRKRYLAPPPLHLAFTSPSSTGAEWTWAIEPESSLEERRGIPVTLAPSQRGPHRHAARERSPSAHNRSTVTRDTTILPVQYFLQIVQNGCSTRLTWIQSELLQFQEPFPHG